MMGLGLSGAVLGAKRINKLNAVLPVERRYPVAGTWHFLKIRAFRREYRQVFGVDNLTWQTWSVEGLMLLGFVTVVWLLSVSR
jgi:hypothetical protein